MKNNKYTWQYLSKGSFKTSIDSNVNFVFNEKNIYISDNHLCALWGWIKCCRPGEKYNFIHIDFHNDLKCPDVIYMPDLYKVRRIKKFNDFLRRRFVCENGLLKRFVAWDSYIQIAYFFISRMVYRYFVYNIRMSPKRKCYILQKSLSCNRLRRSSDRYT